MNIFDDYTDLDSDDDTPSYKECKFCGKGGLIWEELEKDQWKLLEKSGRVHKCKPKLLPFNLDFIPWTKPTKENKIISIPIRIIAEDYSEYENFLHRAGIGSGSPDYIYIHSIERLRGIRSGVIIILLRASYRGNWLEIRNMLQHASNRIQIVYQIQEPL